MSNYFKHKMRSKSPVEIAGWVILGIIAAIGLATLFGFIIMWLWNALMPEIFGLIQINYWQAVGLFILAKIIFGGFGSGDSSSKGPSGKRKRNKSCDEKPKKDFSKWEFYDKFWEEEGDKAYQAYLNRQNQTETDAEIIIDENNEES